MVVIRDDLHERIRNTNNFHERYENTFHFRNMLLKFGVLYCLFEKFDGFQHQGSSLYHLSLDKAEIFFQWKMGKNSNKSEKNDRRGYGSYLREEVEEQIIRKARKLTIAVDDIRKVG